MSDQNSTHDHSNGTGEFRTQRSPQSTLQDYLQKFEKAHDENLLQKLPAETYTNSYPLCCLIKLEGADIESKNITALSRGFKRTASYWKGTWVALRSPSCR
ncbi:hypothetical protein CEXT_246781 [Caerostris extrusa]|uniref:Uncharacterized protein n=1 Tax=Caerostris extrusa TaxID=172846 RepID=A0AAV4YB82_CAEEX|nr:hypothetical protein CEXT_246781 [Caerostris extrusa]